MALITPADAIPVPWRLALSRSNEWNTIDAVTSSTGTLAGTKAFTTAPGGGMWEGILREIALETPDDVRMFRAIRGLAKNGVMPLIVYRNDAMLPPFPLDAYGRPIMSNEPLPHSDGTLFSDGTGHTQPVIVAYSVGLHDLNGTSLHLRFESGGPLRGGESVSVWTPDHGWRLHEILGVDQYQAEQLCEITPWLRDGFEADTQLELDCPRCTMRLADPKAMNFRFSTNPNPTPDAAFEEYFFPVDG